MKDELQVVPERNVWIVKKNNIVHSIHTTREAAVKVAKILAHNLRIELIIYSRNGDIFRTRPA
jgi:hypothetical protein